MTPDQSTRRPSEILAEQLRTIRDQRGYSAQDVSDRLEEFGVSMDRTKLAKIEQGQRKVSLDEAFALAFALDVSPIYLFTPLTPDDFVYVCGGYAVDSIAAREWVRGQHPLPEQDDRVFWTVRPDREWRMAREPGLMRLRALVRDLGNSVAANLTDAFDDDLALLETEVRRFRDELERKKAQAKPKNRRT